MMCWYMNPKAQRKKSPYATAKKLISDISTRDTEVKNEIAIPKRPPPTRATRRDIARNDWTTGRARYSKIPKTMTTMNATHNMYNQIRDKPAVHANGSTATDLHCLIAFEVPTTHEAVPFGDTHHAQLYTSSTQTLQAVRRGHSWKATSFVTAQSFPVKPFEQTLPSVGVSLVACA
mmetsp:Transcript_36467/g.58720  ORF Transcript_36467/g.58720 Transcript_36467/m.58720 type:complete len:176 (-) Transcript_36467:835-1362(-)